MAKMKSIEVGLAIKTTAELINGLDALRAAWKLEPASVPKGLSCSESKDGQFILVATESAFVTLPGACVIKGIGAVELLGTEPVFEPGANSKSLLLPARWVPLRPPPLPRLLRLRRRVSLICGRMSPPVRPPPH